MAEVYASNRPWSYTGTESTANASYIYAYFKAQGWSDSAVAGLVGNTTHESYNNPGFHEVCGSGFGIVQWTPSSNYTSWAAPRGFPIGTDYSNPEKYMSCFLCRRELVSLGLSGTFSDPVGTHPMHPPGYRA